MIQVGFGGGCHWCTEGVFLHLQGVSKVRQGWIASTPPHDSFSEAVIVSFDAEIIPPQVLVEIHLRTHASTENHSMRNKYRSAVYFVDDNQKLELSKMIENLQRRFDKPLITEVLKLERFKLNDSKYLDYYRKNPEKPFCQTYIDPKLDLIRQDYSQYTT